MSQDISLQITSPNSSSERRIAVSWTIARLKSKLEPVTGIPPSAQRLLLRRNAAGVTASGAATVDRSGAARGGAGREEVIEAPDEENTSLEGWSLGKGMEIFVEDTRPPSLRQDFSDPSKVEKYTIPDELYDQRRDSVLAWKRSNKLGRFDPAAADKAANAAEHHEREARARDLQVGRRCRVGGEDTRRGTIRYLGPVPEIPHKAAATGARQSAGEGGGSSGGWWVGIELDEPAGKNDGSIAAQDGSSQRYFTTEGNRKSGVFVRPERVEVGDFPPLDLDGLEEI